MAPYSRSRRAAAPRGRAKSPVSQYGLAATQQTKIKKKQGQDHQHNTPKSVANNTKLSITHSNEAKRPTGANAPPVGDVSKANCRETQRANHSNALD